MLLGRRPLWVSLLGPEKNTGLCVLIGGTPLVVTDSASAQKPRALPARRPAPHETVCSTYIVYCHAHTRALVLEKGVAFFPSFQRPSGEYQFEFESAPSSCCEENSRRDDGGLEAESSQRAILRHMPGRASTGCGGACKVSRSMRSCVCASHFFLLRFSFGRIKRLT